MSKPAAKPSTQSKLDQAAQKANPSPGIHFLQKVIKGDTYLVMSDPQYSVEDEFANNYFTMQASTRIIIQPPLDPKALARLVQKNNTLLQCIEAMEVNIDGTGYEFVAKDEETKIDEAEKKAAISFFGEPVPNESFVTQRRSLRFDIEGVGYGFLEALRNIKEEVVGVRNMLSHTVRFVKLDAPVQVTKTIQRDGKDVEITMFERERRFAQRLWGVKADSMIYYREFGSSRHINRNTGDWETKDNPVKVEDRGTELILFGLVPDVDTPYFLPRWINNLPSVVGSRKAEEWNLEYFDAGGMPPAIIFVQGGTLAGDVSDQLKTFLSGKIKNNTRAAVVEAQSSSGSLDSAGTVKVSVERFGAEKSNDSMYQAYDKQTAEHVRGAFRITQLFLGNASDLNFATALTAYMVAEAQVFAPERTKFDEAINKTLMKALGFKTIKMKSNPITLKNVEVQLQGLEMISTYAEKKSFFEEVEKITGVSVEFDQKAADAAMALTTLPLNVNASSPTFRPGPQQKPAPAGGSNTAQGGTNPKKPVGASTGVKKSAGELLELVQQYARAKKLIKGPDLAPSIKAMVQKEVRELSVEDDQAFMQLLATVVLGNPGMAPLVHDHAEVA